MSLTRGRYIGYEFDRIDGGKEITRAISTSAMDALEREARTGPEQREARFMHLSDRIEACAEGPLFSQV